MARIPESFERRRERIEGQLTRLGSAMVIMLLIAQRLGLAMQMLGRPELIGPAIEDLQRVQGLVSGVQQSIADGYRQEGSQ